MAELLSWERRQPGARVLQVTNMWPVETVPPGPSGSPGPRFGIFVKRQVDSLIEAGVACDVLFVRGFRSRAAYAIAAASFLALGFARRRYQLLHVHAGETALAARFYLTAPVIVTYYGSDLLGAPEANGSISVPERIRCAAQHAHARLLTRTITQSQQMERRLPSSARARNLVIPSGIDSALFRPIEPDVARKRLGWSSTERVALFAANPEVPVKRHWLAKAASELAGQSLDSLRLHIAANVEPDDMPTLMSAADCLLVTSSSEGSPNVVKEAVLCGLPVVTTRVGDVEDVLAGVEPSWICESNAEALGAAVVECLSQRHRSNGHEAGAWLRSEAIARRHLDLYEQLAPGSTSPRW